MALSVRPTRLPISLAVNPNTQYSLFKLSSPKDMIISFIPVIYYTFFQKSSNVKKYFDGVNSLPYLQAIL
jgi:hypothetical protein